MSTEGYNQQFFQQVLEGSLTSAETIVPLLIDAIQPKSVVDIGCAEGAWLSVFERNGIGDVYGIDGDYVDRARLRIDSTKFCPVDLEQGFSLKRKFDLAICLEVAEHLRESAADRMVDSLAAHSDCILFSASIPHQDGTNHLNEQWLEYWTRKFRLRNYEPYDYIRPLVWNNKLVRWWFAQNAIVYVKKDNATLIARFEKMILKQSVDPLSVVHPELFKYKEDCLKALRNNNQSLRWLFRQIARVILSR